MIQREREFKIRIHTPDDWYPTAKDGTVEVTVMLLTHDYNEHHDYFVRTCVWGEDDFGMEKDLYFPLTNEGLQEAIKAYDSAVEFIKPLKSITVDDLKAAGFVTA